MEKKRENYYRILFLISAIYDLILGIVFTFFYKWALGLLGIQVDPSEYGGYLSLIGVFLFVIGIAYWLIYRGDLYKNRDLIIIGAFYKLAYSSVAFVYFALGMIPHILFVASFGVLDFIMFLLMLECLQYLKKNPA